MRSPDRRWAGSIQSRLFVFACLLLFVASVPVGAISESGEPAPRVRITHVDAEDPDRIVLSFRVPKHVFEGEDPSRLTLMVNGENQPAVIRPNERPPEVALVVDTSGSMKGTAIETAGEAARTCLDGLPADSTVSYTTYATNVTTVVEPTTNHQFILDATQNMTAIGDTSTYDAMVHTADLFSQAGPDTDGQGRYIVLMSDGDDTASSATPAQAIRAIEEAELSVYAISMITDDTNNAALSALASVENGTLIEGGESDLVDICGTIASEIASVFTVAFASPDDADSAIVTLFLEGRNTKSASSVDVDIEDNTWVAKADTWLDPALVLPVEAGAGSPTDDDAMAIEPTIGKPGSDSSDGSDPSNGSPGTSDPGPSERPGQADSSVQAGDDPAGSAGDATGGNDAGGADSANGSDAESPSELAFSPDDEVAATTGATGATGALPTPYALAEQDGIMAALTAPWVPWLGAGLIFGAALLFILTRPKKKSAAVLRALEGRTVEATEKKTLKDQFAPLMNALSESVGKVMEGRGWGANLDRFLDRSGLSLKPNEYVTALLFAGVAAAGLFAILGYRIVAIPVLFIAPIIVHKLVGRRGNKRIAAFQEQLVDTLMIMAGSLQSGHGLMQAVKAVADQSEEPTSSEFNRVMAESRIGRDPMDSLQGIVDRTGSDDFHWSVKAMNLNRELGGNLSEVLTNVADTIRERNRLADQVNVLSAEGKFSAYTLLALPFGVVGVVRLLNPEYISVLFNTRAGWGVTAGALTMMAVGALWIRNMIKIEY